MSPYPQAFPLATFLFTDIVRSTERTAEVGDSRWRLVLDIHHQLARRQVTRQGGRLVKSTGYGILAIFAEPGQAVGCAFELMDALREIDVEIRAGIHTGEIEDRGRHIGGIAVHIAARAQALAGSGAVFVTRTVRDLMTGSGFAFKDEGTRELKGIPEPWQLFEVSRET